MQPEQKKILYITLIVVIIVLAIVLGLVFGLRKSEEEKKQTPDKEDDKIDVLNLYNNTAELIKLFPVINNTTVLPDIEEKIQNRLLTGFVNWNRGFKTWKAWGNILYTNESIYNVHGARLSLAHYQAAMDISLQQADIQMGAFHNMLITGNFCAIHYDFTTKGKTSKVMEFVRFTDYGSETNPDTRVVEGWGSTKDDSYYGLINFQGKEEREEQEKQNKFNLDYQIPTTDNLTEKYNITYPTKYLDENADDIFQILLKGFDEWNEGASNYIQWVNEYFAENATSSSLDERVRNMDQYKSEINERFQKEKITKLYFDNVLIRENWAALHYRFRTENLKSTNKTVGDRMEFYKFQEIEGNLKIVANWIQ